MGQAIGQIIGIGVGVALSPIPIIAVVLMLATPRGRINGPAFLVGWVVGLGVAGTVLLLLAGTTDTTDAGGPSDSVGTAKVVLGALLLLLAARRYRGRPRGDAEPALPSWMHAIDAFTPVKSAGIAVLLSALNPKNLILVAAAAAAIAGTGASSGDQAVALALFVVIGTLGPGIPVAIYFLMGERATDILERLRGWMVHENATIMAVLCLVIGAKLIGDGITALS